MVTGGTGGPPPPWWVIYLTVGSVVAALYGFLPHGGTAGIGRVVVYTAITLSAAVAVGVGVARNRPAQRLPWLLLAAGQVMFAAGDAAFYVANDVLGSSSFPALADVFYLARYPLAVAGLALLVSRRTGVRDVTGLLDASTVTIGAALLSWLFIVSPLARADLSTADKVVLLAYPILDLALLAVALRLVLGPGRRPPAFHLLTGSLLLIFAADTIYSYQTLHGQFRTGTIDVLWLIGNLALGAAALHPTMGDLTLRSEVETGHPSRLRPWLLLGATLVAPAALLAQVVRGRLTDVAVTAAACALLFTVAALRMEALVSQQRHLAITDSLTGLYTRRFLESEIPPRIARAARGHESMALLIIDVDHFKDVNDRYGHPVGDQVLIEITRRLRTACGPGDILARYGGEEFAMLARGPGDDGLEAFATRVRAAVSTGPVVPAPGLAVDVTVSVGAAAYPRHGRAATDLLVHADRALYRAKAQGRNRAVVTADADDPGPVAGAVAAVEPGVAALTRLAGDVDRRDQRPSGEAVGGLARRVAAAMGLDDETARRTELAARLRDVGRVVLAGGGPDLERMHPDFGARLVRTQPGLGDVAEIVRQHHENYDGSGYPDGAAGRDIRVEARVVAACERWCDLRAAPLPRDQARTRLCQLRGTVLDPDAVDALVGLPAEVR